jgi:hypothetical protein
MVFPIGRYFNWIQPYSLYLTYFSLTPLLVFSTWHWRGSFVAGGVVLAFLLRHRPPSITTSSSLAALPVPASSSHTGAHVQLAAATPHHHPRLSVCWNESTVDPLCVASYGRKGVKTVCCMFQRYVSIVVYQCGKK